MQNGEQKSSTSQIDNYLTYPSELNVREQVNCKKKERLL